VKEEIDLITSELNKLILVKENADYEEGVHAEAHNVHQLN
jgi:hypothetical protein